MSIIELAVTLTWSWLWQGGQHSLTQRCARGGDVYVGTGYTSIWQSIGRRNVPS